MNNITENINIINFSFTPEETGFTEARLLQILQQGKIELEYLQVSLTEIYKHMVSICDIRAIVRILKYNEFSLDKKTLYADNIKFNCGTIINHQLKSSQYLFAYILTIGNKPEAHSASLNRAGHFPDAYAFDYVASEIVEIASDKLCEKLKVNIPDSESTLSNRFSPGYCGWNVNEQHQFFTLFPQKNIGVTLTESALMYPVKSVSGIMGAGRLVKFSDYNCENCDYADCYKRKLREN